MRWLSLSPSLPARAALVLGLVAAGLGGVALTPAHRAVTARPADPALPIGPEYAPADAAVFVYADVAALWGGSTVTAIREADPKTFAELTTKAKGMFGVAPDALRSVTLFWPKFKGPQDAAAFGVVLAFSAAYDAEKLTAGIKTLLPGELKFKLHAVSDRVAVLLSGLDEGYAKPRPADKAGPLTAALREAASGKHIAVVASALASLPDEIRGESLPPEVRAFQPIFQAESIVGLVDQGKELAIEARVTAASPAKAVEVEKAFGVVRNLLQESLGEGTKEVGKQATKEPALKDVLTILTAVEAGLKGATFTTTGTEARARVAIPADLPFGPAFVTGVVKTREAAARAQSSNNLKQIALAMHNYHDTFGAMPPAAVVDKAGKPLLSWRVLILPYIEQQALYMQFKLDEPWDSEHNKKLLDKMPKVYAVPNDAAAKPTETRYRVFVGNGAVFDYLKGPKLTEITDGTSNTIMAVTAATPVPWTKPDELAFDPDQDMGKLLWADASRHITVAFCDGSVRSFKKAPVKVTLNALITRGGGEVIGDLDE